MIEIIMNIEKVSMLGFKKNNKVLPRRRNTQKKNNLLKNIALYFKEFTRLIK